MKGRETKGRERVKLENGEGHGWLPLHVYDFVVKFFIMPSSSSLLNLLYSQIFNSPLLCFLFSARMLFSAFSPLYLCFKPSPSIFRELLCKFSSSLLFFLFCMNLALPVLQLCLFSILHELGSASSSALLFFLPSLCSL